MIIVTGQDGDPSQENGYLEQAWASYEACIKFKDNNSRRKTKKRKKEMIL